MLLVAAPARLPPRPGELALPLRDPLGAAGGGNERRGGAVAAGGGLAVVAHRVGDADHPGVAEDVDEQVAEEAREHGRGHAAQQGPEGEVRRHVGHGEPQREERVQRQAAAHRPPLHGVAPRQPEHQRGERRPEQHALQGPDHLVRGGRRPFGVDARQPGLDESEDPHPQPRRDHQSHRAARQADAGRCGMVEHGRLGFGRGDGHRWGREMRIEARGIARTEGVTRRGDAARSRLRTNSARRSA